MANSSVAIPKRPRKPQLLPIELTTKASYGVEAPPRQFVIRACGTIHMRAHNRHVSSQLPRPA